MAIRIRVYPQNGGVGGVGGYGVGNPGGFGVGGPGGFGMNPYAADGRFMQAQLQNQKQLSGTQLTYERALWGERLQRVRLEERLAAQGQVGWGGSPGGNWGVPIAQPGIVPGYGQGYGQGYPGYPQGAPAGFLLGGAMGGMFGGLFGGAGQVNHTSQVANGPASQRVSNANTYNVMNTSTPFVGAGFPFGGGGGGGFLSGLLGALI